MTRADLEHKIAVLLGGRAAESSCSASCPPGRRTIWRATDIARDMITRFGMDEGLGYIAFEAQRPRFSTSPELAQWRLPGARIDQARIDQAIPRHRDGRVRARHRILDTNARCWSVVRANCWRGKRFRRNDIPVN